MVLKYLLYWHLCRKNEVNSILQKFGKIRIRFFLEGRIRIFFFPQGFDRIRAFFSQGSDRIRVFFSKVGFGSGLNKPGSATLVKTVAPQTAIYRSNSQNWSLITQLTPYAGQVKKRVFDVSLEIVETFFSFLLLLSTN